MTIWLTEHQIKNPRNSIPRSSPEFFQKRIWWLYKREKISKKVCFAVLEKHFNLFVSRPNVIKYYVELWKYFLLLFQVCNMGPSLRDLKEEISSKVSKIAFKIGLKKNGITDNITKGYWFE